MYDNIRGINDPISRQDLNFKPRPDLDWPVLQKGNLTRLIQILGNNTVVEDIGAHPTPESLAHLNNLFLLSQITLKTILLEYSFRNNNPYGTKYDQSLLTIANHLPNLIAEKKYQRTDLFDLDQNLDSLLATFDIPKAYFKIFSAPDNSDPKNLYSVTERTILLLYNVSPDNNLPSDMSAYRQQVEAQLKKIFRIANKHLKNIQQNTLPPTTPDNYARFVEDPYMLSLRRQWAQNRRQPHSIANREAAIKAKNVKKAQFEKRQKVIKAQKEKDQKIYLKNQAEYFRQRNKDFKQRNKLLKERHIIPQNIHEPARKLHLIGELVQLIDYLSSFQSAADLQRFAITFHNYGSEVSGMDYLHHAILTRDESHQYLRTTAQNLWQNKSLDAVRILSDLTNAAFIELELSHSKSPKVTDYEQRLADKLAEHEQALTNNSPTLSSLEQLALQFLSKKEVQTT